jgi:hypothetical protein
MKHNKANFTRSRDPTDIFYKRILEMMRDYDLTMQDAINWDMDGFMPYPSRGMILTDEEEIDFYLHVNYVPESSRFFFTGVALGLYDYTLKDKEEEAKQEDDRSASTPR